MSDLTHIDSDGKVVMVDVSDKATSTRTAIATGQITISEEAYRIATSGNTKKGDPIAVAELAGVMAAKKTSDIIPLCHPLPLTNVKVSIKPNGAQSLVVTAKAKTSGKTGVEMEALTAASVACLTLYDMLKAIDKSMVIGEIKLLEKTGGVSGNYKRASE